MHLLTALFCLAFALPVVAADATPGALHEAPPTAQTILHLLDYIGVDYAGAVEDGKVKNADEYAEMREFGTQVARRIAALPDTPLRASLSDAAHALGKRIEEKAPPAQVAADASKLRHALTIAYALVLTPRVTPDLARGRALYTQNCAACHGAQGRGDGPAAVGLDPTPANFHDAIRMKQRSAYGLYNTITLGVGGTAMAAYPALSEADRWALAFFVSIMGVPETQLAQGEKLWKQGAARAAFPDLHDVAALSADEVAAKHGAAMVPVHTYLRAHPQALAAGKPAPLSFARAKLAEARAAHAGGDRRAARDAAIQAYLEGFELVETSLANLDAALMHDIEKRMLDLRAAIERDEPAPRFAQRVADVDALLVEAETKLDSGALSPASAFGGSLLILLREGLEAILVLAAIVAFVRKTGRRDAMPWVHAGWIAALALGGVTWAVATFLIDISGANREMTEGVTALLASAMLLYVGYWLHGKSYAQAWNRFIRDSVGQALSKSTLWAMAGVSFLAVYREVFEVVLFYQALWTQAGPEGHGAVLGGIAVAALLLAVCAFVILRYSVRLPLGPFFGATSALLALLAVIFAGHGVAALQEAGVVGVDRLSFSAVPLLGIYPSSETVASQLVALALVLLGFAAARRTAKTSSRGSA